MMMQPDEKFFLHRYEQNIQIIHQNVLLWDIETNFASWKWAQNFKKPTESQEDSLIWYVVCPQLHDTCKFS